jgi:hypothetical protein
MIKLTTIWVASMLFFRDGYDTVRREKISANSKILMA